MKLNTTFKTLCAAVALAGSAAANAGSFYLDIGTDYTGTIGVADKGQVTATSTSMKEQFKFAYQSATTIFDSNNDNAISAGDTLTTTFGLPVSNDISRNFVTALTPGQLLNGNNSNNGLNVNYALSFGGSNLVGQVYGMNGGVPLFAYAPGARLEMFITTDGTTMINFMDVVLTGGIATGVSTMLNGKVDFSQVDAGSSAYWNLFHSASGLACSGGSSGFYDLWNQCGDDAVTIDFSGTMDTNVQATQFAPVFGNPGNPADITAFSISSDHNGAGTFAVPEPASLALLGAGLFGLGAARRRKIAA